MKQRNFNSTSSLEVIEMAITPGEINDLYEKYMRSASDERISARTIYDYCISPFMIYCDKFGPEDKKDTITQYQELLFDQGKTHEIQVIETTYPETEKLEYETPEQGFKLLLEEMNKGVNILCGLPAFYLPEDLTGRFDILEREDTEPSIFGPYHYVVREIKLAKNIQKYH